MADSIRIDVDLDTNRAERAGKNLTSSLNKSFLTLGATLAGVGATLLGVFASRRVIEAASKQQDAINQLNTSLRLAGSFSLEASQSIQNFASELQRTTTIGDETTLELVALARNFARTNEEATRLTEAAINLSAATGISLDSAVKNLGKTFAGLTGELGESVPAIRELTAEQLKAGEAINLIADRFGGAAQAQTQTFSGALQQLENQFGDLLETIGEVVITSPGLVSIFNQISSAISTGIDSVQKFSQSGNLLDEILLRLIGFGQGINTFVIGPFELLGNTAQLVFQSIRVGVDGLIQGFAEIAGAAADLASAFGVESELVQNLQQFRESGRMVLEETANDFKNAQNNLFGIETTQQFDQFLIELQSTVEQAKPLLAELGQSGVDATKKTADSVKKITVDLGKTIQSGLVNVLATSVAALGSSLVQGASAFDNFAKTIFNILGDLAIQIGSTLVGAGLGIEALKTLTGTAAIAAGLGLIALGGILKGLGAGGGSGAAPAPTQVQNVDQTTTPTVETIEEEAVASTGPSTTVNLNVAGDILDSDETGGRLVTLLNDAFDKEGVVIQQTGIA